MNINICIHDSGKAKIKRTAYISEDAAYAVTTIEIVGLIIDLFHGVDEYPLNDQHEPLPKAASRKDD